MIKQMPDCILKKRALSYAEDEEFYTSTCKRMYVKHDSPPVSLMPAQLALDRSIIASSSSSNYDDILREEEDKNLPRNDIECIERYKEGVDEINWKECYDAGRRDTYFKSYSTPASLKSAYFRKAFIFFSLIDSRSEVPVKYPRIDLPHNYVVNRQSIVFDVQVLKSGKIKRSIKAPASGGLCVKLSSVNSSDRGKTTVLALKEVMLYSFYNDADILCRNINHKDGDNYNNTLKNLNKKSQ